MRTDTAVQRGIMTDKMRRFVLAHIIYNDVEKSAISAGYSPSTAMTQGYKLLKHPEVSKVLAHARRGLVALAGTTAEKLLAEICKIAYSDIRKLFDERGYLLPPHAWPEDMAGAISSVKVITKRVPGTDPIEIEYVSEFKFWDKNKAHEQLGRHLEIFADDKAANDVQRSLAERLRAARQRHERGLLPAPSVPVAEIAAIEAEYEEIVLAYDPVAVTEIEDE